LIESVVPIRKIATRTRIEKSSLDMQPPASLQRRPR
jgi:hypothetical protein